MSQTGASSALTTKRRPRCSSLTRRVLVAAARLLNATFFLATAVYAVVCSVPFAYHQFIEPHVWRWPSVFVENHHYLYWACLALTLATFRWSGALLPRAAQLAYAVAGLGVGLVLITSPLLATWAGSRTGLLLGVASLVFPLGLGLIDLVNLPPTLVRQGPGGPPLRAAATAAALVALAYAALAFFRTFVWGDAVLLPRAFALGMGVSAATHVCAFMIAALVYHGTASVVSRLGRAWLQLLVLLFAAALAPASLLALHVLPALTFSNTAGRLVCLALAVVLTVAWTGAAAAFAYGNSTEDVQPLDLLLPRYVSHRRIAQVLAIPAALAVGMFAGPAISHVDWDFAAEGVFTAIIWFATFGAVRRVVAPRAAGRRLNGGGLLLTPLMGVMACAGCGAGLFGVQQAIASDRVPELRLSLANYAVADPSFRLVTRLLSQVEAGETAAHYRYLRAYTNISHRQVSPINVAFNGSGRRATGRVPDVYLFVVDSLRPDYLGAFNARARFTPQIDAFARDSLVFSRAFTRYGATAMAVPSIWTGGMFLHMQYVQPFWPMNALDKFLTEGGYERILSVDPITAQLQRPDALLTRLDEGRPVVTFSLCTTLAELQGQLVARRGQRTPVFAYSLPQDVHISTALRTPVPHGERYPGFVEQVAAQVHKVDGCFGQFIAFLKAEGRYDDSVIILTSDHGDSLGEHGRWGHAYTIDPEVVRVPLVIHVPEAGHFTADTSRLAFSSDIVATLYELLGVAPDDLGPLFGTPVISRGEPLKDRERDTFLTASSYGPVYGILANGGRTYYVSNAVTGIDVAFNLTDLDHPQPLAIDAAMRQRNWTAIRSSIATLSEPYGVRAE